MQLIVSEEADASVEGTHLLYTHDIISFQLAVIEVYVVLGFWGVLAAVQINSRNLERFLVWLNFVVLVAFWAEQSWIITHLSIITAIISIFF